MKKPVKLPAINRKVLSMKTLLRIFSIALVSGVALVSCGKITPAGGNEQGGDTPGTETGGGDEPGGNTDPDVPTRVLSVSFDTEATRTYLGDNGYPYFEENDVILVATTEGEAQTEECTVYYRNGVAMIQTSLPGVLRAVYPAAAADLKNNRIDGVKVPHEQTGLFADANICMVDAIPVDATKVTFLNQTAIFAVTVPANTDQIEVTSLNVISGDLNQSHNDYGFRTDTKAKINNDEESDNYSIIVKPKSRSWSMNNTSGNENDSYAGNSVYYVSVLTNSDYYNWQSNNVLLIDLNFDVISKPDGDSGDIVRKMGGFSPKLLIRGMNLQVSPTAPYYEDAEASSLYFLPSSSLREYEIVDGLKWATMNVGASSPSDPGYYFPWAGVDEHQYINGKWTEDVKYQFIGFDTDWGFYDASGPYYDNSPYSKYSNKDGVTSLALWDDAAYMNWGGAWRTPTTSDFAVLFETGNNGGLTFPAAGYGQDDSLINYGTSSYYWSSNVDKNNYSNAMIQSFSNGDTSSSKLRYFALPVRPVSGVSSVPDEPDDDGLILEIDPYTNGWGTSN